MFVSFKATITTFTTITNTINVALTNPPNPTAAAGDPPTSIAVKFKWRTFTASLITGPNELAVNVETILTPTKPIPTVAPALIALGIDKPNNKPIKHINIGTKI